MEQKKRRINGYILVLAALLILLVFLLYLKESDKKPQMPEPAVINESLKTYYVGNMALDVPESWELNKISSKFYLDNSGEDSKTSYFTIDHPEISFSYKPWSGDQRAAEKLKTELDFAEKEHYGTPVKRQDLSEIFGRPAGIFISERRFSWDYAAPLPPGVEAEPDITELYASLILVEPQVIFKFDYVEEFNWHPEEERAEIIAAKQKMFTDWVLAFLPRYQWTGNNTLPPDGYLPTGYGRIAVEKDWPGSRYESSANFNPRHAANENTSKFVGNLSISFSSHKRLKNEDGPLNRTVAGHAGREIKHLANHIISLDWTDLSSGPFTKENPDIHISGRVDSRQRGTKDIARVLGVWDTVLNSIRPASSNDSKE